MELQLFSDISNNIEMIAGGAMKGSVVASLVASYEDIRDGIAKHIERIDALGTVVTQTLRAEASWTAKLPQQSRALLCSMR